MRNAVQWAQGVLMATLVFLAGMQPVRAAQEAAVPTNQELAALSDEELGQVAAGDFQMNMENFDVMIHDNQAGRFSMDIAQGAFNAAQGVFTTLQAVNSAVDLQVTVNIFLNNQIGSATP